MAAPKKAARKKKGKRTTLRSSKGKKLYAVRNADGTFKDIVDYARSSRADQAKSSKAERSAKRKKKAKKKAAPRKKKAKRKAKK